MSAKIVYGNPILIYSRIRQVLRQPTSPVRTILHNSWCYFVKFTSTNSSKWVLPSIALEARRVARAKADDVVVVFFQRKPFGLFNGPQNDKTFLLLRKSVNLTTFSSLFSTLLPPSAVAARRCEQAAAAVLDLGLRRHLASIQARISLKDRYTAGP